MDIEFEEIEKRESSLDGTCRNMNKIGICSRGFMELSGLIRHSGIKGKTRIVIEYNNDTGNGWVRIVSEDPETFAIQKYRSEHPEDPLSNPIHHD